MSEKVEQIVQGGMSTDSEELESDPGMIFLFDDNADIHNCLLLASVRTVAGAQGDHPVHLASPQPDKKKRFLDHM